MPPGENALGLEEDDGVLDEELQHLLKHGLGGTAGFNPTQEWVTSWQKACVPPHCSMLFAGGLMSKETPHPFPLPPGSHSTRSSSPSRSSCRRLRVFNRTASLKGRTRPSTPSSGR